MAVTNDWGLEAEDIDLIAFRRSLIAWGRIHFRSFPWRLTRDPYRILVAEVMLHRTRASQVEPVYERFVTRCPDASALAAMDKKELREILFPLGLHWRTDLVHEMGIHLVNRFGGMVPEEKEALFTLPGVSDYIAGAVRCFAWNHPEPLADTNTVRIAGRLFGLRVTDSTRRSRRLRELLSILVDPDKPREFNFALLDLADKVCTKRQPPGCKLCPVAEWCSLLGRVLLGEPACEVAKKYGPD